MTPVFDRETRIRAAVKYGFYGALVPVSAAFLGLVVTSIGPSSFLDAVLKGITVKLMTSYGALALLSLVYGGFIAFFGYKDPEIGYIPAGAFVILSGIAVVVSAVVALVLSPVSFDAAPSREASVSSTGGSKWTSS